MEKREGNNKRGMKYKSGRERSIAVAANFPNFVNKLPGTKILKRIVKVLTCSPCDLSPSSSLPSLIANLSVFYPRENNFPRHDLSLSLLFFFPRLACHAYRRNNKAILSSTTLSRRENFTGKRNTRKNRYKYEKYLYVPVLSEQSFTSRKSFSRSTTTTTCKRVLETRKKHDGQFSPRRRLGSTLPSPPLFLPSHKNRKDQRIKGEAKLR